MKRRLFPLAIAISLAAIVVPLARSAAIAGELKPDISLSGGRTPFNPTRKSLNSVADLSDIEPGDWEFRALQQVDRESGCLAGYPDGTFRGNRSLTRYEFAAALNACLANIANREASFNPLSEESLIVIQRLQNEFGAEFSLLRNDVYRLDDRSATVQRQQFSTTAFFGGEVILALTEATGGSPPGDGENQTTLTHLTRLGIVTSFTGRDRLRLELAAGNFGDRGLSNPNALNTDMALLSFQGDTDNSLELNKLEYRFAALGDRVVFTFRPVGFELHSILTANSPYFDAGRGSISRFAEASPLFKIGALDAGVGFDWLVSNRIRLQAAYGTRDSNDPGQGFFSTDRHTMGVQLLLKPAADILTGIAYINGYAEDGRLDTFSGSFRADTASFLDAPARIQGFSGTLQWQFADDLTFGTWGGLMETDAIDSDAEATVTTYLFSLGYSDPFGREGDLLAFLFGQPPKLIDGEDLFLGEDEDTSLHFELLYRLRVSDRIYITPGVFWVTNPEHDADNEDIVIGVLRSTFRF